MAKTFHIRKLVWEKNSTGGYRAMGTGRQEFLIDKGEDGAWYIRRWLEAMPGPFDTLQEAKDAAQQKHEAEILGFLIAPELD